MEKILYDDNSTERYGNIILHELELKWIKLLQTPHPLGFNDNIYHEVNFSSLPKFDFFLFWIFVNIINGQMVNVKIGF